MATLNEAVNEAYKADVKRARNPDGLVAKEGGDSLYIGRSVPGGLNVPTTTLSQRIAELAADQDRRFADILAAGDAMVEVLVPVIDFAAPGARFPWRQWTCHDCRMQSFGEEEDVRHPSDCVVARWRALRVGGREPT